MKLYFYVLDTMADWEYGYLLSELHSKRFFSSPKKEVEIITVSHDKSPKTSMGGLTIVPDITVSEMFFPKTIICCFLAQIDGWKRNKRPYCSKPRNS